MTGLDLGQSVLSVPATLAMLVVPGAESMRMQKSDSVAGQSAPLELDLLFASLRMECAKTSSALLIENVNCGMTRPIPASAPTTRGRVAVLRSHEFHVRLRTAVGADE